MLDLTRRAALRSAIVGATALMTPIGAMTAASAEIGRRRVIIDTDTATDDALALLLAVKAPNISIEAITIVVGNVEFDQEARNALYTLEVAGVGGRYPVYKGIARPLVRGDKHVTATWVHGSDGMSDANFPPPRHNAEDEDAISAIIRLVRRYPGEITIVAIGALTNVAMAMLRDPELPQLIGEVVFMGGFRHFHGNITPAATYNIWVDPEAAKVVFESGVKLTTVGFDVSVQAAVMTDADYGRIEAMNTPLGAFMMRVNKVRRAYCKTHQQMNGSNHPDAITMAYVIDPRIITDKIERACQIDTQSELSRGAMLIDELGVWKRPPNVTVCTRGDEAGFKKMVFAALA
jgi:purine nucleosidase